MYTEKEIEVTSRFLWTASKLLGEISYRTAQHNLNAMSAELRVRRFNFLEFKKDKKYLCPKCNNPWKEGRFSMRVRPINNSGRMKKLIHIPLPSLSPYKRRLLESYRYHDNVMVLRCLICKNVSKCFLKKKQQGIETNIETGTDSNIKHRTKKKNKKKKDVMAGLRLHHVFLKNKVSPINRIKNKLEKPILDPIIPISEDNVNNSNINVEMITKADFSVAKSNGNIESAGNDELTKRENILLSEMKPNIIHSKENVLCHSQILVQNVFNDIKGSNNVKQVLPLYKGTVISDGLLKEGSSHSHYKSNIKRNKFRKTKKRKKQEVYDTKNPKKMNKRKSELKDFINSM